MDKYTQSDVDNLFKEAKQSDRLRAHLNLHSSYQDKVQRLLIGLLQGSFVEPHYHSEPQQWEMFVVLNGVIEFCTYSHDGIELSSEWIGENQDSSMLQIEPNEIHSVKCMSDKALMLEIKEGPFNPENAKTFPVFTQAG